MKKKNYHVQNGKVTKPTNVIPVGAQNVITDNFTDEAGRVTNVSETDANYARRWVDENHL